MKPASGAVLLLALLTGGLGTPAPASEHPTSAARTASTSPIRFKLRARRERLEISEGTRGLQEAARFLERIQGQDFQEGSTWSVLRARLLDPIFRRALDRALALATPRPVWVELHVDRRFIDAEEEKDEDGTSVIRVSERGMAEEDLPSRLATFIHEVGHSGDPEHCEEYFEYGPDDEHQSEEVLSPVTAFQEGWPNHLGAAIPGSELAVEAASPPEALTWELPRRGRRPTWAREVEDGYATILPDQLRAAHLLANETWVAAILTRMMRLDPGISGLDEVYEGTVAVPCHHLGTFLHRYAIRFAGVRPELERLLERVFNVGGRQLLDPGALGALLDHGRLPGLAAGTGRPPVPGSQPPGFTARTRR